MLPIYGISFLTYRKKNIWLFGSTFGRRFADNPRYMYLYIAQIEKNKGVRSIWITKERWIADYLTEQGYEAYYYYSLKGICFCLIAGVYIFDNYSKDISFWLSGGAKKINLWHGVGNKKINFDNIHDTLRHPRNHMEAFQNYFLSISNEKPSHYVLATSEIMANIFSSAFQVSREHILVASYPRNDVLVSNIIKNVLLPKEMESVEILNKLVKEGSKIFLYMPTFRESEKLFFEMMDLQKFNDFLKKQGYYFVTKLHPKSKLKEAFNQMDYSNIKDIKAEVDVYAILKYADVLVTDYSSVYSDFLYLDRPAILFTYDYKEYKRDTREEYFTYEDYMTEPRANDMESLMKLMSEAIARTGIADKYQEKRAEVRGWMFTESDYLASEELVNQILQII